MNFAFIYNSLIQNAEEVLNYYLLDVNVTNLALIKKL